MAALAAAAPPLRTSNALGILYVTHRHRLSGNLNLICNPPLSRVACFSELVMGDERLWRAAAVACVCGGGTSLKGSAAALSPEP